jgi:hypothetical protein
MDGVPGAGRLVWAAASGTAGERDVAVSSGGLLHDGVSFAVGVLALR